MTSERVHGQVNDGLGLGSPGRVLRDLARPLGIAGAPRHFLSPVKASSPQPSFGLYACPGFSRANFSPCSVLTAAKTTQLTQESRFCAEVPLALSPHNVPVTAQQSLPPFLPPFSLSQLESVEAGHGPSSIARTPPCCLPQRFISQQFFFLTTPEIRLIRNDLNPALHPILRRTPANVNGHSAYAPSTASVA